MEILRKSDTNRIDHFIGIILPIFSIILLGTIVIDYGFPLNDSDAQLIANIYNIGWWVFFLTFTYQLWAHWGQIRRKTLLQTTLLATALYFSALPKIFGTPEDGTLSQIFEVAQNKYFVVALLGILSLLELSRALTRFVNRRTNPSLLIVIGFAFTIILGALLLMLPRSTMEHIKLPIIDALFTSASAVCVTGLSTVEVAHTFTFEGQIIIILLIQIGGLGIMTITTFFAVFFMDKVGLYSQFALKDMLSSGMESLTTTLRHVLGFTIVIELIGAVCVWLSIHPMEGMSLSDEIFFSLFHAISAFCNAGFSTLEGGLGNEAVFLHYNTFYLLISTLIILGGIGFPILINLKKQFAYSFKRLRYRLRHKENTLPRFSHLTSVNTRIVLRATAILIGLGTLFILILEYNGALAGMSFGEKVVHSFFNAVVPRTAGFNSVTIADFSRLTLLLIIVLMWIGGASQSTAGGVKVNTIAVAFASIKSLIRGQSATELYNREITHNTTRRALVMIICSVVVIAAFFIGILILEPHMSTMAILFETVSAFSTVGLSLGITPELCSGSKFLLVMLMFIGRVGFLTVMMSILPRPKPHKYRLPKEEIIIN